jgi:hypothetical protein
VAFLISPHSQDYGPGCTNPGPLSCGPNDLLVKPHAIGPTVDVNLFRGISAEVGFLYERFHKDFTQGLTAPHRGPVNFGQQYSISADGWLFPLLLKYNFGRRRITPFAEAGGTLRHLGPFDAKESNWTSSSSVNRLRFISKAVEPWTLPSLLARGSDGGYQLSMLHPRSGSCTGRRKTINRFKIRPC